MKCRTVVLALLLAAGAAAQPPEHVKSAAATHSRVAPGGHDLLWTDPLQWTWVESGRENTAVYLHQSGLAQARLIVTSQPKTPRVQLEETLERVRKIAPEARVAFEEQRIVNGAAMLCVQILAPRAEQDDVVYYGYLYGGDTRSVQLFTIAPQPKLGALYVELTTLLDGLEIRKEAQ